MKKIEILWQYRVVFYSLSLVLFLIPLYVNTSVVFPFTTGKSFLFIGLVLFTSIFYLWGKIKEPSSILQFKINGLFLALFVIVLCVSSYFAVVPNHAFFGEFAGGGSMLVIAGVLFAALFAFTLKLNNRYILFYLRTILISSILYVLGVYGGEAVFKNSGDAGSIGNTSYAGAYLLVVFFIAIAVALISVKKWDRIFSWIAVLFIGFSPILFNTELLKSSDVLKKVIANPTVLSGPANGAVFGIAVGIVAVISLFLIRSKKKFIQFSGLVLLVGLFVSLWIAGQALVTPETRLHQWYVADKNANRFVFWDIAYAGVNDKPLFGWGMNAYAYTFQEKFDSVFFSPGHAIELWTNNPHNMIAEYAVATGYVGLIVYVFILGSTGVTLFVASRSEDRVQRVVSILMFGALVGYVVQNFFVFDTVVPMMLFFVLVGYALYLQHSYKITLGRHAGVLKWFYGLFIFVVAFLIYISSILPIQEAKTFVRYARNSQSIIGMSNPQFISNAGYAGDVSVIISKIVTYYSAKADEIAKDPIAAEQVNRVLKKVTDDMLDTIRNDGRGNFRAYWLIGQTYIKMFEFTGKKDFELLSEAKNYLQKARDINPNNPEIYYNLASTSLFEKDYKTSQTYLRAYIALAPEYKNGYQYAQKIIDGGVATKDFKEYVSFMKEKWCSAESACMNDKWK